MSYREGDPNTPDTNVRSYLCMRSFQYEVGGQADNIEAHQWLNAMRKDGWHLVSTATSVGKISRMDLGGGYSGPGQPTTFEGNVITFVMEGSKPDPTPGSRHDMLCPIQDALLATKTYGQDQW